MKGRPRRWTGGLGQVRTADWNEDDLTGHWANLFQMLSCPESH